MPHQCLKCGKIFEEGSSTILKGCPGCNGNRFFFTKEPLDDKEREKIYSKTSKDINSKVLDILGIDKNNFSKNELKIPENRFLNYDITNGFKINRQFDLAISLEIAEHIHYRYAKDFIKYLTSLSPIILFSAAIPHQGGIGHINERRPEFWTKLFEKKNFTVIDCIRDKIWNEKDIAYWYRQNILI